MNDITNKKLKQLNKEIYLKIMEFVEKEKIGISFYSVNNKYSEFTVNEECDNGCEEENYDFLNTEYQKD